MRGSVLCRIEKQTRASMEKERMERGEEWDSGRPGRGLDSPWHPIGGLLRRVDVGILCCRRTDVLRLFDRGGGGWALFLGIESLIFGKGISDRPSRRDTEDEKGHGHMRLGRQQRRAIVRFKGGPCRGESL